MRVMRERDLTTKRKLSQNKRSSLQYLAEIRFKYNFFISKRWITGSFFGAASEKPRTAVKFSGQCDRTRLRVSRRTFEHASTETFPERNRIGLGKHASVLPTDLKEKLY